MWSLRLRCLARPGSRRIISAAARTGLGLGHGSKATQACITHGEQPRRCRADGRPRPPPKPTPSPPSKTDHGARENIYTLPNFLTATRLAAAPAVGWLVLENRPAWALGLLVYAAVTDLVDGWIARRWKQTTVVGTVIDPMADKALMLSLTLCLATNGSLPPWVAIIILGRDIGLGLAAIYYRWISLPPPKTFARYWDFSLPSAEVRPTTISKYNTFLQLALVGLTTAAPLINADLSSALGIMHYLVAGTTVWSGASYVFSKDAVRILSKK
ncbi:hypothetical protein CDD82_3456 [Ophiocordyceps australis]|uniref:CDP-diacylglycerol--glycerol-3-phosphate 3-phosphatidyltransferase n=1 Tax=Ophiocordyceps australis TaxID=1399860 RepID=A0A2C5ZDU8_9HYPO|nr:hypothetical protein CDD82_3456 [Ophiocordyceps australis]